MKIIIEVQQVCTPFPRGIPIYTAQLVRHLLKRNRFDYSVAFFDKDRERNNWKYIDKYFGEYNVNTYECNTESYRTLLENDSVYSYKSYNNLIGAGEAIFHFPHFYPIPTKLDGKMVVTVHDLIPLKFPEFFNEKEYKMFNYWWNKLLEMEPYIIVDSIATKNDIHNISNYNNVYVVHLGYDKKIYFPDKQPNSLENFEMNFPYLFYCGAMDTRKNISRVIDAFELISNANPDVKLVLAGDVNSREPSIRRKIEEKTLNGKIISLGFISDELKRKLISNATAYIFASIYEGFGLPILEAMACGCPVITSNVSSMPEVAGDAAIYVDPYNTLDIAEAFYNVVNSEKIRNSMKKNGFIQAKKFSWDKTAETIEQIYGMLV